MAQISLPARLFGGLVTATEAQVYTVPAGETDVITSITLSNVTDVAQQASAKFAGIFFFKNIDLAPRQITVIDVKQVLNAGDAIILSAGNASSVTAFISGVKITTI
jgi:hypothetical protein